MNTPLQKRTKIDSTTALAAELGLSRWAVSRALNGRPGVSKATAARIRAALTEHQFEPDPLARALRGGASSAVAICLPRGMLIQEGVDAPDLALEAMKSGLYTLCKQLADSSLDPIIFTSQDGPDEPDTLRQALALRPAAVVLVCPQARAAELASFNLEDHPVACVCIAPANELPIPTIRPDLDQAAKITLEHLHQLGHKKFALLGIHRKSAMRRSYENAAKSLGFSERAMVRFLDADDLPTAPLTAASLGWSLVDTVLRRRLGVTALVAASDEVALGGLARIKQERRQVPEEFSVVGCGNVALAAYSDPPLSTIDLQVSRLFEQAGRTLCELMRMRAQIETREILVNPLFFKRSSTGLAKAIS